MFSLLLKDLISDFFFCEIDFVSSQNEIIEIKKKKSCILSQKQLCDITNLILWYHMYIDILWYKKRLNILSSKKIVLNFVIFQNHFCDIS